MAVVEILLANHSPQEYTVLSALSSASCREFMFSVVCIMTAVCVCVYVCVSSTHKFDLQPIKRVCLHPHT